MLAPTLLLLFDRGSWGAWSQEHILGWSSWAGLEQTYGLRGDSETDLWTDMNGVASDRVMMVDSSTSNSEGGTTQQHHTVNTLSKGIRDSCCGEPDQQDCRESHPEKSLQCVIIPEHKMTESDKLLHMSFLSYIWNGGNSQTISVWSKCSRIGSLIGSDR